MRAVLWASVVSALWVFCAGCNSNNGDATSPCATGSASCPLSSSSGSGSSSSTSTPSGPIITTGSFTPGDAATGVPTSTTIQVAVAGGVDSTSYTYDAGALDTISVTDSAGTKMPINVTPTSGGLTISFGTAAPCNLYPNTGYTISVSGITNAANPPQTSGTVTTTFTTNSTYQGPSCYDPVIKWTVPTTAVNTSNGTTVPLTDTLTSYKLYYENGPCENPGSGGPSTITQDSAAKNVSITATGQSPQSYTLSVPFLPDENARFAIEACTSSSCSVPTPEVCTIVAPPSAN